MLVESQSDEIIPQVGNRIECNGHYGTIKYIGAVAGHQHEWLGIDWDDADRGKHNGKVQNVQYFNATYPKSGSFVRKEKVNLGRSLIYGITSRYGKVDDENAAKLNHQNLLIIQQSINAPFLQLVGFENVIEKQA